MGTVVVIIEIIFGILGLILFFKVWAMTDDVKELKDNIIPYLQNNGIKPVDKKDEEDDRFTPGTIVVEVTTGRQLKIKNRLPDGRYKCSYNHDLFVTEIEASKLVTLEEYQTKNNK